MGKTYTTNTYHEVVRVSARWTGAEQATYLTRTPGLGFARTRSDRDAGAQNRASAVRYGPAWRPK
jgi:hypothetical protein